jgi:hypothetical protein
MNYLNKNITLFKIFFLIVILLMSKNTLAQETLDEKGTATITGTAFMHAFFQQSIPNGHGGLTHFSNKKDKELNCAGNDVQLIPKNKTSDHVVDMMFRYSTINDTKIVPSSISSTTRHTICSADGRFNFFNIPIGIWYVVTLIGNDKVVIKEIETYAKKTTAVTLQYRWSYPPSWRHPPYLW